MKVDCVPLSWPTLLYVPRRWRSKETAGTFILAVLIKHALMFRNTTWSTVRAFALKPISQKSERLPPSSASRGVQPSETPGATPFPYQSLDRTIIYPTRMKIHGLTTLGICPSNLLKHVQGRSHASPMRSGPYVPPRCSRAIHLQAFAFHFQ